MGEQRLCGEDGGGQKWWRGRQQFFPPAPTASYLISRRGLFLHVKLGVGGHLVLESSIYGNLLKGFPVLLIVKIIATVNPHCKCSY